MKSVVYVGGASGGFVDSAIAVPQLLRAEKLDYIIFDFLAEGSMGIVGKMLAADPKSGFFREFADIHVRPYLAQLSARKIKVIANAGGLNPNGLAALLSEYAQALNLDVKVAAVAGDDLREQIDQFRRERVVDMFSGAPFPEQNISSINAYLGAFPIAEALAKGAEIVVTGRVVDSALVLGPLIHEFGWKRDDYDLLAAGTTAGHLLECGCQVTGGTFTDWRDVPDWENTGFPIGECQADGGFVITKPAETGGLVSVGTVSEQLLYEVSDPQCYIVPDVVCDFASVELEQVGPDRVRVTGARGYPPTSQYKVCVTYDDGWRSVALQTVIGLDAAAKAQRQAEAVLQRTAAILRERNLPAWRRTHIELIGNEGSYGARARPLNNREIISKIVVDHDDPATGAVLWREQNAAILNMSVGTAPGLASAAPPSLPVTGLFLFLVDKERVTPTVTFEGREEPGPVDTQGGFDAAMIRRPSPPAEPERAESPDAASLVELAWARSGDKGNLFNVAVIARRPEFLPYLYAALTPEVVAKWYAHFFDDPERARVDRYFAPGIDAFNLVLHDAQGGGINTSMRLDTAAKSMAQHLLEFPVPVPAAVARAARAAGASRSAYEEATRHG